MNFFSIRRLVFLWLFSLVGCAQSQEPDSKRESLSNINITGMEKATFGAGCFWCVEAIFQELIGVEAVVAGYSGGHVKNPTYKEICTGNTGHAEVAQIIYDPGKISFEELLEVFWHTHDPTTLNKQGADEGTQYRSVIFYHNEKQQEAAEKSRMETDASGLWSDPIVTEIVPLEIFYEAENYHQDYFDNNPNQPYCNYVIKPKLDKFRKKFKEKLKN